MRNLFLATTCFSYLLCIGFAYGEFASPGMSIGTGLIFVSGIVSIFGYLNFEFDYRRREVAVAAWVAVGLAALTNLYVINFISRWGLVTAIWGICHLPLLAVGFLHGRPPSDSIENVKQTKTVSKSGWAPDFEKAFWLMTA